MTLELEKNLLFAPTDELKVFDRFRASIFYPSLPRPFIDALLSSSKLIAPLSIN